MNGKWSCDTRFVLCSNRKSIDRETIKNDGGRQKRHEEMK